MSESEVSYIPLLAPLLTGLGEEWDEDSWRQLWDDYFKRMVGFARWKLGGISRQDYDEEDAASDAMHNFCKGMKEHKFRHIHDEDGLRSLLFRITKFTVSDRRKKYFAIKRGGELARNESSLKTPFEDIEKHGKLVGILGKQPTPTLEQEVSGEDEFQRMLELLQDETHRRVAIRTLEEYSIKEIADELGCVLQTVHNKLDEIRHKMLVYMIGLKQTPGLTEDDIKEYQSQLNKLSGDLREIAVDWFKGLTPREIAKKRKNAKKTISTYLAVNHELLRIARIWESNR